MTKIFWDSYGLRNPHSGVSVYGIKLKSELNLLECDPKIVAVHDLLNNKFLAALSSQEKILKEIGKERALLHGLSNINLPLWRRKPEKLKTVLTVHDVIPLLFPDQVSVAYKTQFSILLPRALKNADKVICVSEWTRRSLLQFYKVEEEKLVVIPNGIEVPCDGIPRLARNDEVTALTVSRSEPYKRLNLVLEILKIAEKKIKFTVVTDQAGVHWFNQNGSRFISNGTLLVKTSLSKAEMEKEFSLASVYVHPSKCEGFCLPAAEAQSHLIPVVFTKGTGIDEVVGKEFGFGLNADEKASKWFEATLEMSAQGRNETFRSSLAQHLKSKNTWKDSAKAVKLIYDQLLA